MSHSVILSARRTPIGRFMGGLSRVASPELGSMVVKAALEEVAGSSDRIDECIMGCVLQAGLGQNPARQAGLKAGLPVSLNAQTINKVCGSGLQSVMLADQSIRAGDNAVVMAGGFENMSMSPHLAHVRAGLKFGDGKLIDHMAHDGLTCAFEEWGMGFAAEHTADKVGVSREDMDAFSARSHQRAAEATEKGWFKDEILPLDAKSIKQRADVTEDEGIRGDSTADGLGKLRPAFKKDGTVTAGNASQISDGAAALIVASAEAAGEMGAEPLARIVGTHTQGVEPKNLFEAPGLGIEALLASHGLSAGDVDLYEINEAFAAQAIANIRHLGLDEDKVNICGGGIALGHPIGGSGARVLTTLLHQMKRVDAKRGIASLCLGGGNAVSMLVERD
ncbi:MAG: acetyl-CoA C-acyltransferase [Phycisphaerae bacterium]|nr:acetyl-CoA C-acyltransferase [Phycisphaerae bacterium]|tara:strand:+ start:382 stop:1557 length:1176 start_codon:yes stop_codon:yes gene_type:complete